MPDIRKCAIYGCRSNSRDNNDLKFFNFPARDNPVYAQWRELCHESAEALERIRRPYICSNHFNPWQIGYRRLAVGALPQLHLKAPPGFEEEEKARVEEELAAQREKARLLKLTNDSVLKWITRAKNHPEFGEPLCTSRRELQRIATEIRNLLGATLIFPTDDYWLRKFRKTHLPLLDDLSKSNVDDQNEVQSMDLMEIILSIDPDVKFASEEEIEILIEEEKKNILKKQRNRTIDISLSEMETKQKAKKRSHSESMDQSYDREYSSPTPVIVKSETLDSFEDDGFEIDSVDSGHQDVVSEPIVETYKQALEHLKPLEDFALREENYRIIGLLSTLESIFKNP